jgi:hypothetical protein
LLVTEVYNFKNLAAIAKNFEEKAKAARTRMDTFGPKAQARHECRGEFQAWTSAAYILRNAKLREVPHGAGAGSGKAAKKKGEKK